MNNENKENTKFFTTPVARLNRTLVKKKYVNRKNNGNTSSIMYKQSLKANNKSLAKALDVAKQEIALVIQRHTELVKLNQDQAATISVLKRMADTSSEAIEKQVQERMAMKSERMRSRLDLVVSHMQSALDSLLDTILLCDGQSTHDLDQAIKDTLEMTSRQTPACNSQAVGGKPSRTIYGGHSKRAGAAAASDLPMQTTPSPEDRFDHSDKVEADSDSACDNLEAAFSLEITPVTPPEASPRLSIVDEAAERRRTRSNSRRESLNPEVLFSRLSRNRASEPERDADAADKQTDSADRLLPTRSRQRRRAAGNFSPKGALLEPVISGLPAQPTASSQAVKDKSEDPAHGSGHGAGLNSTFVVSATSPVVPATSPVVSAASPVVSAHPSPALPSAAHKDPEAVTEEPVATAAPSKPSKRQSAASKRQTARRTVDAELSVPAETESYVKAEPKPPVRQMEITCKGGQISVAVGSRDGGPARTKGKKTKKAPSKQAATSVSDKTNSVSKPPDPFDLSFSDTFCAELPTAPANRLKASHKPDATTPQDEPSPPPAKHPARRGRPARSHAKTDNHLADSSSPDSPVVSGQSRKNKRRLAADADADYVDTSSAPRSPPASVLRRPRRRATAVLRILDSPSLSESAASPALHLSEEEGEGQKPDLAEPVSTRAYSHERLDGSPDHQQSPPDARANESPPLPTSGEDSVSPAASDVEEMMVMMPPADRGDAASARSASPLSHESDEVMNRPRRRAAAAVNLKEPSLNRKMRRPDDSPRSHRKSQVQSRKTLGPGGKKK